MVLDNKKIQILYAISLYSNGYKDQLKFVKNMFLCNSIYNNIFSYNYYRWDYGPFDKKIHLDIDVLAFEKLISISHDSHERILTISKLGVDFLKKNQLKEGEEISIKNNFLKFSHYSRNEILTKIYKDFNMYQYEMGDSIP